MSDMEATVSRLVWLQFAIGAVVVVLLAVLSYLLVRTSLRPLRRVEETAHAIAAAGPQPPRAARHAGHRGRKPAGVPEHHAGAMQQAFATTAASERQARASEEEMRRFIADASHELRTPLTWIKGFAELYSQGGVPDVPDAMRRINDEANRMNVLVEDLLMLARLGAQRPLDTAPVDLLGLATDAVSSAHRRSRPRHPAGGERERPPTGGGR